jgi:hypothetical protein
MVQGVGRDVLGGIVLHALIAQGNRFVLGGGSTVGAVVCFVAHVMLLDRLRGHS